MAFDIAKKIITLFRRRNPMEYAKYLGVSYGKHCRFVDNPDWGSEPYLIKIGNHVLISGQVAFLTHDGATFLFREEGKYKNVLKFGTIEIGDNTFVGYRSIIMPNVKIGSNVIIAAGAVVSKNIPDGEVWGGVPAKFICKTADYAEKCLEQKLDYDIEEIKKNKKAELCKLFKIGRINE